MKGFVALPFIAIILVGALLAIILPAIAMKTHIIVAITNTYNYENSQLILLSLLTSTALDSVSGKTKPTSEIIGEFLQSETKPDTSAIETKLDNIVDSRCFELSSDTMIEKSGCKASKYIAATLLPVPYNPNSLLKELKLVIDK